MRKLMASLVIIALIMCQIPVSVLAINSNYITAEDVSGEVGDTVTLEIVAKTDLTIDDLSLTVTYDSSKLYTENSSNGEEEDEDGNLIVIDNPYLIMLESLPNKLAGISNEGPITMGAFDFKTFKISAGQKIFSIKFKILEAGESPISIELESANSNKNINYDETITATVTGTTPAVAATGVTLSKTSTTIKQGKTDTITATVSPEDATDKTVTWTSSNTSVATVNNGTITAVSKGTATITAETSNGKTATCTVTVTQPVTGVFIMKDNSVMHSISIEKGAQETLTAEVAPSNADDKNVIWSSSDENIATVNNGVVTGVEKGTATITATSAEDNTIKATCTVTVGVGIQSIGLNETTKTIKNGDSYTFIVTYNPEDTDIDKKISWSSSNPQVAIVDDNGKVTVYTCSGTAEITATLNADNTKKATATVVAAHKDEKLTLHAAKAATCIAEGNTDYYTCSGCDDWFKDDTGRVKIEDKTSVILPINEDAHDWNDWVVEKEATCTEEGLRTRTCKLDSNHTPQTEAIEKTKHELNRTDAVEATCEKDGNIEYYTCSACGKYFKDDTASVEITEADTIVKALGHDWGNWVETTPATTEAEGVETRTCKNDSSHIETRAIPKIHKHELVKTEAKAATCVAEGNIEYWTCSECKKTFSDSEGIQEIDNVIIAINTNAHDWNDWVVEKEATCTEEGVQTRTCKLDKSHTETEAIEKIAHKLTKTDAKDATCEEDGNIEYYTCSECGKYFKDSTARTEITKADTVIKATGHDWDDGTITTPKTCTTDGVKTYTCKNDSNHTRTETIPTSHELVKHEAKAATCVAEGNIEYWECSECGKKFSEAEGKTEVDNVVIAINPDAHDWDEWVIEKEATVDEIGSKTRTCKLDKSHTETAEIARLPYAILNGDNQVYTYEEGSELVIRANGTFDKFVELQIDGVTLKLGTDYTVESGSTIAKIKPEYLNTLSAGNHTATFVYTDGTVSTNFKVAQAETNEKTTDNANSTDSTNNETTTMLSPKTGDNIMVWISLMIVSVIGIIGIDKFIRRKDQ